MAALSIGAEIIATPGCESNVKEIFDACWDIRKNRPECVIFNQFDEFGNYLWHYGVTGPAVEEVVRAAGGRLAGWVGATGSAGTLAAGDYLKQRFPGCTITAVEALQCPTLLRCGFGGHRIEGIGDKHVPWIHNARNTDLVAAIDDEATMRLLRLFNEPAGHALLARRGVDSALIGESAAARHLEHLQPAGGDQDGAPLRARARTTCCSPASPTRRRFTARGSPS